MVFFVGGRAGDEMTDRKWNYNELLIRKEAREKRDFALTENSPVRGASLKKAKVSMGILTFLATPDEFWKGTGSV